MCYTVRNTLDELKEKVSEDDKKKVQDKCTEVAAWLDENRESDKESFSEKVKELEAVYHPIVKSAYDSGVPGETVPEAVPEAGGKGPSVEEVD